MKINVKIIINAMIFIIVGLVATKLGEAYRLADGIYFNDKLPNIIDGILLAFQNFKPSFHQFDLIVGVVCGGIFSGIVYLIYNIINKYNKKKNKIPDDIIDEELKRCDAMTGNAFEQYCAELLKDNGYKNVEVTKKEGSRGDGGADVLAKKGRKTYVFQCKRYKSNVNYEAVQQALSGKIGRKCKVGVVLTNNEYFTKAAIERAKQLNIELWNRTRLAELIRNKKRNF